MPRKLLLIQKSKPGTGSTLAANILWGLIEPESPIRYLACAPEAVIEKASEVFPRRVNLIKTHTWEIKAATQLFSSSFAVLFVCTERGRKRISESDRSLPNVVTFRYQDILETEDNPIEEIVKQFHRKLTKALPIPLEMSIPCALKRVSDMNIRYQEIANRPFSYVEKFYHIHGSHRGRWKN